MLVASTIKKCGRKFRFTRTSLLLRVFLSHFDSCLIRNVRIMLTGIVSGLLALIVDYETLRRP